MRRLLVVEDDAAIRDGIVELLRRNGYAAAAVTDFADVAAQVLDAAPDLLLLDLNLPGVDGGFVCREVRAKSQVPIIAVTSRDTDMDELVTLSAGADDFVTKPYNDQVLLARIASLLKRSYGEGAAASARISVRAASLALVALALAAYGVEVGVVTLVTVLLAAGEAVALLVDFWRRWGFYQRLDRTTDGLAKHGVAYLASELTREPATLEEAAFLDALRRASKSMADQVAIMRAEQRDYRDYVETWVHEVKTPIAAGRLVAANNPGPVADAMDAELGRIEGYVEQALYYARSTTLDRDFQVREVVLADVVRAALRRNARTLIDARVTPELGELGLTVSADPKWVEFMLGQLMGNAAKYRREDAEAGRLRVWASCRQTGMDAWETLLFVEDDGVGIPPEDPGTCV